MKPPLASRACPIAVGHLPATTRAARGDPEAGWEDPSLGHSHGVGPIYPASHRASDHSAMGTPFSPSQLRIPPTALGPSGGAPRASEYPGRLGLGGGRGLAGVLRPGQSLRATESEAKARSTR